MNAVAGPVGSRGSPIEVAHSLPTGAAVATVAVEGYDLGSVVRAWRSAEG